MWQLLKNARIYGPHPMREKDILMVGTQIAALGEGLALPSFVEGEVVELDGMTVVPGFIDGHVHICGGGGENGPASRTPEIQFSQLAEAGITTVVGLLGFDTVSKSVAQLLLKAMALESEGLTTYIYSGAYSFPPPRLLGGLREDLALISKVIGAGEIAISDHRSSQPRLDELKRLASDARVGGMLGGKAGLVHCHVGEGPKGLGLIWAVVQDTEIPITQFYPTHLNRSSALFEEGMRFLQAGGQVDLTAGCDDFAEELRVPALLSTMVHRRLLNERVTVSSDGNGSLPQFNEAGELVGMGVGSVDVLWRDVRKSVIDYGLPLETALPVITSNPASVLKLPYKGKIAVGMDGDLVALDGDLQIEHVWAKGTWITKHQSLMGKSCFSPHI